MRWWPLYRADIRRYTSSSGASAVVQRLAQPGLGAVPQYRLASAVIGRGHGSGTYRDPQGEGTR